MYLPVDILFLQWPGAKPRTPTLICLLLFRRHGGGLSREPFHKVLQVVQELRFAPVFQVCLGSARFSQSVYWDIWSRFWSWSSLPVFIHVHIVWNPPMGSIWTRFWSWSCWSDFFRINCTFKGTSLDLQIFTYTGPIDSLRQASHPSHLLLHNLHHSIHTLLRRRLPRLLHMLLNFGPTLRPVTRRPPQLHLRTLNLYHNLTNTSQRHAAA